MNKLKETVTSQPQGQARRQMPKLTHARSPFIETLQAVHEVEQVTTPCMSTTMMGDLCQTAGRHLDGDSATDQRHS